MKLFAKILAGLLIFMVLASLVIFIAFKIKQQQIISAISETIREYVNADVEIGTVGVNFFAAFPHPSLEISHLAIKDTLFPLHKKQFLQADDVLIALSVASVISGTPAIEGLTIKNGEFNIFTDPANVSNDYVFKGRKVSGRKANKLIERLRIENMKFNSVNLQKNNHLSIEIRELDARINKEKQVYVLNTNCEIFIKAAIFRNNPSKFLSNKTLTANFKMNYDSQSQTLNADSIDINLNGRELNIGVAIDLSGPAPVVSSKINSGKILLF